LFDPPSSEFKRYEHVFNWTPSYLYFIFNIYIVPDNCRKNSGGAELTFSVFGTNPNRPAFGVLCLVSLPISIRS